jgi:hypothetical protein
MATYLLVKLYEGWFEKFIDVRTIVVWILCVRQTLAHICLFMQEILFNLSWKCMQWNDQVLSVSDLLKLDVGYLLVVDVLRVMSWDITWKFWYVRSHI